MYYTTRIDRIRNQYVRETIKVEQSQIYWENWLRWFGHVNRRPTIALLRKSDVIPNDDNARGTCKPNLNLNETIKKS